MFLNSKFLKFFGVFTLIFIMTVAAFADTVRLKDGRTIKGKITGFVNGRFTVTFDDGTRSRQMSFSADEVESILFDSTSIPTTNSNASNTTVITVGQNKPRSEPQTVQQTVSAQPPSSNTGRSASTNNSASITIPVKVLADNTSNGWTNSGWVVRKGQKIKITGTGRVSLGAGRFSTPGGINSLSDSEKLIKDKPTGGLIAVIGDDNNDFIFIGDAIEFTAVRDGALFLGVNEGNLNDNSGAFDVKVEISPEAGN